jgi:hypothetical protein
MLVVLNIIKENFLNIMIFILMIVVPKMLLNFLRLQIELLIMLYYKIKEF